MFILLVSIGMLPQHYSIVDRLNVIVSISYYLKKVNKCNKHVKLNLPYLEKYKYLHFYPHNKVIKNLGRYKLRLGLY